MPKSDTFYHHPAYRRNDFQRYISHIFPINVWWNLVFLYQFDPSKFEERTFKCIWFREYAENGHHNIPKKPYIKPVLNRPSVFNVPEVEKLTFSILNRPWWSQKKYFQPTRTPASGSNRHRHCPICCSGKSTGTGARRKHFFGIPQGRFDIEKVILESFLRRGVLLFRPDHPIPAGTCNFPAGWPVRAFCGYRMQKKVSFLKSLGSISYTKKSLFKVSGR